MLNREKRETIMDRKLNEYIQEKEEEEKGYFSFKARPMSSTTKVEKMEVKFIIIIMSFLCIFFIYFFKKRVLNGRKKKINRIELSSCRVGMIVIRNMNLECIR